MFFFFFVVVFSDAMLYYKNPIINNNYGENEIFSTGRTLAALLNNDRGDDAVNDSADNEVDENDQK